MLYTSATMLLWPAEARTQESNADVISTTVAVVTYVRGDATGPIVVDPRVLGVEADRLSGFRSVRDSDVLTLLASVANVSIRHLEDVRQCSGPTPRDCRLAGAAMLLAVSDPLVDGDSAEIFVSVWSYDPTYKRQPVGTKDLRLSLKRDNDSWRVVAETVLRQS